MKLSKVILVATVTVLSLWAAPVLAGDEHGHAGKEEREGGDGHGHGDEHGHKGKEEGEGGDGHGDEHGHDEEGEMALSDATLAESGIRLSAAGPGDIEVTLPLTGQIKPVQGRAAHIAPRVAGVVQDVRKQVGDTVAAGETIATIQSNQNLQVISIESLIPGQLVFRHASRGEYVSESEEIFIVADLSEVWAELYAFKDDLSKVREGQEVIVFNPATGHRKRSTISFVSPVTDAATQSRTLRVTLPDEHREFSPGVFVSADVILEKVSVPLAIDPSAVQSIEGKDTVFIREEQRLEAREVRIGKRGVEKVEILSGIKAGETYASGNTFILKAEAGKSSAGHEH